MTPTRCSEAKDVLRHRLDLVKNGSPEVARREVEPRDRGRGVVHAGTHISSPRAEVIVEAIAAAAAAMTTVPMQWQADIF